MTCRSFLRVCLALLAASVLAQAPFPYLPGKAYHILPETHTDESGYFSLNEGLDGTIFVGTAAYSRNAYLVAFDPHRETQKIVLDTHQLLGLTATGYAAQAKLHTRNFTAASGKVFVGSKQGYRRGKEDTAEYPGGYVMTWDPRVGKAESLGMPYPGEGVIDVVADEERELLYVVTCETQHWMLGDLAGKHYRELGPLLTHYATTLIDPRGVASVLTKDWHLAQYDPAIDKVRVRPLRLGDEPWVDPAKPRGVPTWVMGPDQRYAWCLLMSDATLYSIDLMHQGETVPVRSHGTLVAGNKPDSRSALTLAPDGQLYAIIKVNNDTGYGTGALHWLARFNPTTLKGEQLGVLTVANPDFFDFGPGPDGKTKPWTHGYHKLPDGTMTPLHNHMALIATADNTLYATIIYPFTLLRLEQFRRPAPLATPVRRHLESSLAAVLAASDKVPEATMLGAELARRYYIGAQIELHANGQALTPELLGRSGGFMHLGKFLANGGAERNAGQIQHDTVLAGWEREPTREDVAKLRQYREQKRYIVGFGARDWPPLKEVVALCDAFVDNGLKDGDVVLRNEAGVAVGRAAAIRNTIHAWMVIGEKVGALTRSGKMPPMWKSYAYDDGRAWADRYLGKGAFHQDVTVAKVPDGEVARQWLARLEYHLRRALLHETPKLEAAATLIQAQWAKGLATSVAWAGHMPGTYIAQGEDARWAKPIEAHGGVAKMVENYFLNTEDGALVLRLGYLGEHEALLKVMRKKNQELLLICGEGRKPTYPIPPEARLRVDAGYAFGDACVWLPGYPIPVLPPSGVVQAVLYEAISAGVLYAPPPSIKPADPIADDPL